MQKLLMHDAFFILHKLLEEYLQNSSAPKYIHHDLQVCILLNKSD